MSSATSTATRTRDLVAGYATYTTSDAITADAAPAARSLPTTLPATTYPTTITLPPPSISLTA